MSNGKPSVVDRARQRVNMEREQHGTMFLLLLGISLFTFIVDYLNEFWRGQGPHWIILMYFLVAILLSMDLKERTGDPHIKMIGVRLAASVLGPWGLFMLQGWISSSGLLAGSPGWETLVGLILSPYAGIIILYAAGFPGYFVSEAAREEGAIGQLFGFIHLLIVILLFLGILYPAIGGLIEAGAFGDDVSLSDTPGALEVWEKIVEVFDNVLTGARTGVGTATTGLIDYATPTYHTGVVEQQQGRPLGVTIQDLQPTRTVFPIWITTEENEQGEIDWSRSFSQIAWFGTVRARSFADLLEIELRCIYEHQDDGYDNLTNPARPSRIAVQFTGQFADERPFDCSFDREMFSNEFGTDPPLTALRGKFFVGMNYTFDTWGYATWTFMDNDRYLALRRDNIDPARELEIDRTAVARYTPGPMALGMERVQQPIPVDVRNPERNRFLTFSITLDPISRTRGNVERINKLIFQVPDPFSLDLQECSGFPAEWQDSMGQQTTILPSGTTVQVSATDDRTTIPDGYTWYEWEGIEFADDQRYKTLRCPLVLDEGSDPAEWPWGALLGPDLAPRQFTLVAQVNYDFYGETPVPVRIGLEREQ